MNRLHPARWSVRTWIAIVLTVGTVGMFGGGS